MQLFGVWRRDLQVAEAVMTKQTTSSFRNPLVAPITLLLQTAPVWDDISWPRQVANGPRSRLSRHQTQQECKIPSLPPLSMTSACTEAKSLVLD